MARATSLGELVVKGAANRWTRTCCTGWTAKWPARRSTRPLGHQRRIPAIGAATGTPTWCSPRNRLPVPGRPTQRQTHTLLQDRTTSTSAGDPTIIVTPAWRPTRPDKALVRLRSDLPDLTRFPDGLACLPVHGWRGAPWWRMGIPGWTCESCKECWLRRN